MHAKKQPGFYVLAALFFLGYLYVMRLLWHRWVPYNTLTDTLSLLVMVAVVLPLAAVSAGMVLKFIRTLLRYTRIGRQS